MKCIRNQVIVEYAVFKVDWGFQICRLLTAEPVICCINTGVWYVMQDKDGTLVKLHCIIEN